MRSDFTSSAMNRKSLSLKAKGVSKKRGARSKQSSWQTSINSYFGGKPLPVQPTLNHFLQQQQQQNEQGVAMVTTNSTSEKIRKPLETVDIMPEENTLTHNTHPTLTNNIIITTSSRETSPTSTTTVKSELPLGQLQPPLSELLINPSSPPVVVAKRKASTNPFAKLHQGTNSSSSSSLRQINKSNLSLRVRKRKFIMSPSKPRQEKPDKQVMNEDGTRVDENRLSAFTPPLFTTPTPSHTSTHTPSLLSHHDRDILNQYYVTKTTTPCRRLCLADLEVDGSSNDVIATSNDVIDKSCDEANQLQPSLNETVRQGDQSNCSFSEYDALFDQSNLLNLSCDTPSKSHGVVNKSHDLFDQSHDSFDEIIKHSHTDDIIPQSHDLRRYLVLESVVREWDSEGGRRSRPELMLRLLEQSAMTENIVYLRDEWVQIPVSPGDTVQVNLPPEWNGDSPCIIDGSNEGSVIVSPDILIAPTAIATSITCPRRAILAELFKGISKDNIAMVTGNLLHQVLQGILVKWEECRNQAVARDDIDEMIRTVVSSPEALNQIYSLGMTDEEILSLLIAYIPSINDWCERFLHHTPLTGRGDIEFKRGVCDSDGMVCLSVHKVHDIEENIWSPRLGLKGKVDATIQIKMRRMGERVESSHRVPLEIKTGKMFRKQGSLEHRAQVSLYSVMLRDRYGNGCDGNSIPGGLLYYMKADHMQGLPAELHDIKSLLMARNVVAGYYGNLASHMTLPGMLKDSHVCKYCPYLPQCCLTHRSLEQGTADTSGLKELFTSHIDHLSNKHLQFFNHWCGLVIREDWRDRGREAANTFWNYTSADREKEGVAMGNMLACQPKRGHSINRHLQKFTRQSSPSHFHTSTLSHPHTHTFSLNERIVVSREDGKAWAIAMGTVTMATDGEIELLLDKAVSWDGTEYRLDVAPGYHGSASLTNLARLCSSDSERDAQLRNLLIDLRPPRYHTSPITHFTPISQTTATSQTTSTISISSVDSLNSNQKLALNKVLCSKDYTLILGRPGTGKTTTISCLVQTLVAMGASVLVTSYTHSAVDNILLKLKEMTGPG